MGSSGSGNFSDYPGGRGSGAGGSGSGPGAGASGGGSSGGDPCDKAFETELEDVKQSQYYSVTGGVPKVGTPITIERSKRMIARADSGDIIGNLPTSMNDLAACIEGGWSYVGTVVASADGAPEPSVTIEAAGIAP